MINRITLNLKRESQRQSVITWSTKTFEHVSLAGSGRSAETVDQYPLTVLNHCSTPGSRSAHGEA